MSTVDLMPTVVALLTAHANNQHHTARELIDELTADERTLLVGILTELLLQEVRLGCADAGIPLDEYLSIMGRAAAEATEP